MPETTNTEKLLLAVLAGAAAGIAIGILMAPDKGSETRKKLKDMAEELFSKVREEHAENQATNKNE
jgi:gas vesicle protein